MKRKHSSPSSSNTQRHAQGGKLRIIGGDYRRRQLPVLNRPGLRPTPDRVRETLFNWLGQSLFAQRGLDLFAGTGALGIEALSRGASEIVFIEQDRDVASQITANLATLGAEHGQVLTADASTFLSQPGLSQLGSAFDLVFLDPPFHLGLAAPCCEMLETHGWLSADAMIYLECETSLTPDMPSNWSLYRETRAGDTTARLYQRHSD
ncbi:16S rRNA (guanine(966)-N(2))-methyltransferase RsmD [Halomonas sp. LS-001]